MPTDRSYDPYNRDRKIYDNNYDKRYDSNDDNYNSPLKTSSSLLMRPTKTKRFQNENLVVHRVSPFHYQYRYRINDDMNYRNKNYPIDRDNRDQSYNVEKEKQYNQYMNKMNNNRNIDIPPQYNDNSIPNNQNNNINNYNRYSETNRERMRNSNNNFDNNNNYNNPNVKYRTPNNPNNNVLRNSNNNDSRRPLNYNEMNNNRNFNNDDNYGKNNNYNDNYNNQRIDEDNNMIRRNNSDLNYMRNKNFIETEKDKQNKQYYLKNPIEYYRGEDILDVDDGYRHYSPDTNNYNGSKYGGYIYNYYLNAPMRGDKSVDWRFPPLYYYNPKYDPKRKIYTNYH